MAKAKPKSTFRERRELAETIASELFTANGKPVKYLMLTNRLCDDWGSWSEEVVADRIFLALSGGRWVKAKRGKKREAK